MSDKVELKPCPFCGGQAEIVCCDDEGNPRSVDYEQDPWSGIGYRIKHSIEKNEDCPIAKYEGDGAVMGIYIYDTREEATQYWNKRANNTAGKTAIDFEADVEKVQHGRWIDELVECNGLAEIKSVCSLCGNPNKQYKPPYCPHCGAKMDKE